MWRICFLICLALTPVLRAELKLMAVLDDKPWPVVRVDKATLFANRDGKEVEVPRDASFVVEGDLLAEWDHAVLHRLFNVDRRIEPVTLDGKASSRVLGIDFYRGKVGVGRSIPVQLHPDDEAEPAVVVFALLGNSESSRAITCTTLDQWGHPRLEYRSTMGLFPGEDNPVVIALCFTNRGWHKVGPDGVPVRSKEILSALLRRDTVKLASIVGGDPEIAWEQTVGGTPVSLAALYGFTEELRILAGSVPDAKRVKSNSTALAAASRNGHAETVKELLGWKPSLKNSAGEDGLTPIIAAAHGNHVEVVKLLLKANVDQSPTDEMPRTAYLDATNRGYHEVAALLEEGARFNRFESRHYETLLARQIQARHYGMVEFFLDRKGAPRSVTELPSLVHHAVGANDARMVKLLIARGAPVKAFADFPPPLHLAAKDASREVVEALLDAKVDVNEEWKGSTALTGAVVSDRAENVKLLLDAGAAYDTKSPSGFGLLEVALLAHAEEAARQLAARGVPLSAKADELSQWIIRGLTLDVAGVLTQAEKLGWDRNALLQGNWNALDIAQACLAKECEAWLMERGVRPNRSPLVAMKSLDERVKPSSTVLPVDTRVGPMKDRDITVTADIVIDEEGRVLFARAIDQSDLSLRVTTAEALLQWRFTKPLHAGVPAATRVRIPLKYPAAKKEVYNMDQLDVKPAPIHREQPAYPFHLKQNGIEGTVIVTFVIDATGAVEQVQVTRATHRDFIDPVVDAMKKWKFKPGIAKGKPVPCRAEQMFTLTLNN